MRWTLISAPISWWPLHRAAYPQYHGGAGNHRWFIAGKRDCVAVRLPEHGRHSVLRRDYDHRRGVHQFHVVRSASYCGSLFGNGAQRGLQPAAVGRMHCPSDALLIFGVHDLQHRLVVFAARADLRLRYRPAQPLRQSQPQRQVPHCRDLGRTVAFADAVGILAERLVTELVVGVRNSPSMSHPSRGRRTRPTCSRQQPEIPKQLLIGASSYSLAMSNAESPAIATSGSLAPSGRPARAILALGGLTPLQRPHRPARLLRLAFL